ncbi:hypothetical protein [Hymenobacter lapidiphilus]|uniref:Uncharacterized protein n=1 Tax=Hymenobacter lapidiphilus TaxID=2608003 RepID=A0A7Y7PSM2_9BACT|nr:hypothetical protein [Hymenobacter lapidiphilus]NVO33215.1 hypothetical protein [Hymenobacter lapidiphilus]
MADISALYLTNVKQAAEALYRENFLALAIDPAHVITANAVLANQRTGNIQQLLQASSTDSVDVVWGTSDGMAVVDCTTDCELTGPKGTGETITITAPICKEIAFSISEEDARRSGRTVEQQTAFMLAQAAVKMDTMVNTQTLVRLKALQDSYKAGTLSGPFAAGVGGVINVTTADYNRKLMANMMRLARLNLMGSPYLIDSGALYVDYMDARFDGANAEGRGDAARVAALMEYFDLEGFVDAAITEDTFIIKPGSVGLFHKHFNPDTPREINGEVGQVRSTFASPAITGMVYDLFSTEKCVAIGATTRTEIVQVHKLKSYIGIQKAAGVGAARPGILLVNQVA